MVMQKSKFKLKHSRELRQIRDVYALRRTVDNETNALSSNSLQVFSRQQITLARGLRSSIQ